MIFDGFGGTGKQMAIDAKKKLKIDWKMNNPDDLVNDVISIFLGYTKPNQMIPSQNLCSNQTSA